MMISVCMAAYNGSLYIEQQLRSILDQLARTDEVVLVDDRSSDATINVVEGIGDDRIRIYRNDSREGVLRTFERAIRLARGDIIFLSDQDDIWYPEKVKMFLQVFAEHPDVTLALSDAKIINDMGEVITESFFESNKGFSPGIWRTIIKNKYLGCSMAFRHFVADKFLPFPDDIPMHDMWIGCINSIYGKPYFLNMTLMAYRRHQYNTSPAKRRGLVQMLVWRWLLIKNLFLRVISQRKH